MSNVYIQDLTPDAAKTSRLSLVDESVAAVLKELGSEYGDVMSATKPYKNILSVTAETPAFDAQRRDVCVRVSVNSDNQTPYDSNYDVTNIFYITSAEAALIAAQAPEGYKKNQMTEIAGTLGNAFNKLRREAVAELKQSLRTGYGEPLTAPPRAKFRKYPATP